MRISDWSSYVCSSYLLTALGAFIVLERQDPYVGLADLRPLQVQAFGLAHPGVDEQLPPPALRAGGHVELRQVRRRIELGRLLLLAQLSDRLLRPGELPDQFPFDGLVQPGAELAQRLVHGVGRSEEPRGGEVGV